MPNLLTGLPALDGSNSIKNLFAEAALPKPGFHQKDVLENKPHDLVCSGDLNIRTAQRARKLERMAQG